MTEAIQIAVQIYLIGFAIAVVIAAMIKGIMAIINRSSAGKNTDGN